MIGAETISDYISDAAWEGAKRAGGLEALKALNRRWIEQMMQQGRRIIDIGPDFAEKRIRGIRSPFYELERRALRERGYPFYSKVFRRSGRFSGGVPGLDFP
ncbi:MAG: hypothetical protein KatS3mg022_2794 [Armatimonadota bacterium]|nr:MAG: hypothetical protein KatS3mg022_2794 [Armatimonadota bacterium]